MADPCSVCKLWTSEKWDKWTESEERAIRRTQRKLDKSGEKLPVSKSLKAKSKLVADPLVSTAHPETHARSPSPLLPPSGSVDPRRAALAAREQQLLANAASMWKWPREVPEDPGQSARTRSRSGSLTGPGPRHQHGKADRDQSSEVPGQTRTQSRSRSRSRSGSRSGPGDTSRDQSKDAPDHTQTRVRSQSRALNKPQQRFRSGEIPEDTLQTRPDFRSGETPEYWDEPEYPEYPGEPEYRGEPEYPGMGG